MPVRMRTAPCPIDYLSSRAPRPAGTHTCMRACSREQCALAQPATRATYRQASLACTGKPKQQRAIVGPVKGPKKHINPAREQQTAVGLSVAAFRCSRRRRTPVVGAQSARWSLLTVPVPAGMKCQGASTQSSLCRVRSASHFRPPESCVRACASMSLCMPCLCRERMRVRATTSRTHECVCAHASAVSGMERRGQLSPSAMMSHWCC